MVRSSTAENLRRDTFYPRTHNLHSHLRLNGATPCHHRHPHEDYCHVSPCAQFSSWCFEAGQF